MENHQLFSLVLKEFHHEFKVFNVIYLFVFAFEFHDFDTFNILQPTANSLFLACFKSE